MRNRIHEGESPTKKEGGKGNAQRSYKPYGKGSKGRGKGKGKFHKKYHKNVANIADEDDAWDDYEDEEECDWNDAEEQEYGEEGAEEDYEAVQQALQQTVDQEYAAFIAKEKETPLVDLSEYVQLEHYDTMVEWLGPDLEGQEEQFADSYHTVYMNINKSLQKKGKGKGKNRFRPKPSNLSIDERKKKLRELKKRTQCKVCGRSGHWAGDPECQLKGGQGKATGMIAANDAVDKTEEEIEDDGSENDGRVSPKKRLREEDRSSRVKKDLD